MNIGSVPLKKFLNKSHEIYQNVLIIAKRARHIIDFRYEANKVEENIEDSDQLEELEPETDIDYNKPKPVSIAINEFMDNKLEWKNLNLEEENEGEE